MTEIEIIREQHRVMELAEKHGIDWKNFIRVGDTALRDMVVQNPLNYVGRVDLKFARALVEGKPVFDGDVVYNPNEKHEMSKRIARNGRWENVNGDLCSHFWDDSTRSYTWNPPKPKIIGDEMNLPSELRKRAEDIGSAWSGHAILLKAAEKIEDYDRLAAENAALMADRDRWKEACIDANSRFTKAEAQLQTLREQKPVAEISLDAPCGISFTKASSIFRVGTKLYTSAPAAPIPEGWQPIKNAPKDGTKIDVWDSYNECRVENIFWLDGMWFAEDSPTPDIGDITHWMPLPAAPKGE